MLISAPMYLRALHRQLLAAVVLFALTLQLLLPAIAGAASNSSERWVEVCAASGVKWVKLDHASSDTEHVAAGHCMLCAATGAASEFDATRYLSRSLAEAQPVSFLAAPHHSFPGHIQRARAPPHLA